MNTDERRFEESWLRLLWGTAVTLLILGIIGSLLVRSGIFDPKPVGELQIAFQSVGEIMVDVKRKVEWLDVLLPDGDFSVRGTAVYQTGNPDTLYGLAIGTDENYLTIAVSPVGYVTIQQSTINNQQSTSLQSPVSSLQSPVPSPQSLIPFQPWPHVRTGSTPNEIWVDVVGDEVTVRINRELLWVGEVEGVGHQVGIVGESFEEMAPSAALNAGVFDFQRLELFWEENHE